MDAAFRLEAVDLELGGRRILRHIDLHVLPGEFITIVGRSGSGKSTLLRVLAGLETPTRGRFTRAARPIMVFQEPRLLPWRSVLQNVCVGLHQPDLAGARAVLEQVGLSGREREYPGVLSGGERQRVALARALMQRPELMLLDEPFGALDALTRLSAQQLVDALWREHGFTAVLVTHDVDEAVRLADRVLVIEQGRLLREVTVDVPRPRRRGSPELAALGAELLAAILGDRAESARDVDHLTA